MNRPIRLGISTCPNDTFAFHGILNREIDLEGLEFEIELLDVQQLNEGLIRGKFDIAKASFHTALLLSSETRVLSCGSALGFGVGPLLLSHHASKTPLDGFAGESVASDASESGGAEAASPIVLCPGQGTTATLLYQLFYPNRGKLRQVVFSQIMPALQAREADFGVCIHEGRFTWQDAGLYKVADLGEKWETETNQPLPLGGLLARRTLDNGLTRRVTKVIRSSIEYGLGHRDATIPTMQKFAQELTGDVLMAHVDLYVNAMTIDLGAQGQVALDALQEMAHRTGVLSPEACKLEIVAP